MALYTNQDRRIHNKQILFIFRTTLTILTSNSVVAGPGTLALPGAMAVRLRLDTLASHARVLLAAVPLTCHSKFTQSMFSNV